MCIVIIINITQCINGRLSLLTFYSLKIRDDHWKEGFFSLIAALLSSPRLHMLWLSPFLWLSIISIDNVIILWSYDNVINDHQVTHVAQTLYVNIAVLDQWDLMFFVFCSWCPTILRVKYDLRCFNNERKKCIFLVMLEFVTAKKIMDKILFKDIRW